MPCHSCHVQVVAVGGAAEAVEIPNPIRSPANHACCGRDGLDERSAVVPRNSTTIPPTTIASGDRIAGTRSSTKH